MQLGSEAQIPDGLLAANALLGENSHQGVPTSTHALYQGFGFVISNTALGLKRSLYDEGVESRCTGKERDPESGLDYFGARYYGSNMGRWMSPDWADKPEAVPYSDLDNPQSLNLYGYVNNNPLSHADPDGHVVGVDDAIEVVTVGVIVGAAVISAYEQTPAGQRSIENLSRAASDNFVSDVKSVKETVSGWFSSKAAAPASPAVPATPDKTGGGKNDQKSNPDRAQSAKDKAEGAKSDLAAAKKLPPSQERSEKVKQAEKQVKHWTSKAAEKSENHSQKPKGQQ